MKNDGMKVIAFYLPQFHYIPENNEWWGENFTEWVNVKKAKPLFDGHVQPKIPLNENYYDLTNDDTKIWQAELANRYGIYGFCYYHYWFNGKMLLEKPMEQMLVNKKIDTHFCVCWANADWTKTWVGDTKKVLIPQTYGGREDWEAHYNYLEPFFKDERYIRVDGKPLVVLYKPEDITDCSDMMSYWKERAEASGLGGLMFAYQTMGMDLQKNPLRNKFDFDIEFQPSYGLYEFDENKFKYLRKFKRALVRFAGRYISKHFHVDLAEVLSPQKTVRRIDFDDIWKKILTTKPVSSKSIPGAFARWDNTPRKQNRGIVYTNNTPKKFENYLTKQIKRAKEEYKKDMIFVYAWNEWAEGGFLEPDEEYGYKYLEAIKNALFKNGYKW